MDLYVLSYFLSTPLVRAPPMNDWLLNCLDSHQNMQSIDLSYLIALVGQLHAHYDMMALHSACWTISSCFDSSASTASTALSLRVLIDLVSAYGLLSSRIDTAINDSHRQHQLKNQLIVHQILNQESTCEIRKVKHKVSHRGFTLMLKSKFVLKKENSSKKIVEEECLARIEHTFESFSNHMLWSVFMQIIG
jgi:hypothetical protein